jgi:septal ring factor EnvC (AmiA/AmiB activator)
MIRLACLLIFLASAAVGQQAAQDAARQLEDARAELAAATGARDRIAALTTAVQAYEAGLSAMRASQRDIALRELALQEELGARREDIASLLVVLTTISKTPQPVLRAHAAGPLDTVRAGMLVAEIAPALDAQTAELQILLQEARAVNAAQLAAAQTLEDGLNGAQTARAALGRAASERSDLPTRFVDDPVQTALLLASAETLGSFAAQLATVTPDQSATLVPAANLPLPVAGLILPDDRSGRSGVRIGAAPRALVTAPAAATVLFQGALLDYGTVVILEPATNVLFVMAGFEEVFVQAGQVLPAGAPIGLLGDAQSYDDGILTENSGIGTGNRMQTLYLEVRDGQGPLNTDAWFALE